MEPIVIVDYSDDIPVSVHSQINPTIQQYKITRCKTYIPYSVQLPHIDSDSL